MAQTGKNRYEMIVLFRPELESKMEAPLKTIADLVTLYLIRTGVAESWHIKSRVRRTLSIVFTSLACRLLRQLKLTQC